MSLKRKAFLIFIGLFVAWISAWWIKSPGYMDADYYYTTGKVLASGGGFSEPFIWNYLDDPKEIPHPAFQYWMPFTSFLSAAGQMIFGGGFRAAQVPFILLTAILPIFTAWIAYKIHGDAQLAWQSGLLAFVPGFFLPFLVTTESFSIYGILGPLVFLSIVEAVRKSGFQRWCICGVLAGIAHLTRADGILFLLIGLLAIFYKPRQKSGAISAMIGGYLLIMLPWWIVNWSISGSIIAPGTSRLLWSTTYDDLFTFPPEKLTLQRWLQTGLGSIILVRLEALWANIKNLLIVNGLIFLGPLMLIGGWKLRKKILIRLVFYYLVLLLSLMSFVFPFAGFRGGYFHSSMAVMPILWALAPLGLREAIEKGVQLRNWKREQALEIFQIASLTLASIVTLALFWMRVVGEDFLNPIWSTSERVYEEAALWFEERGISHSIVAVNNPPGFYSTSGLQSIVIPDGNEDALQQVVEMFDVTWVILDSNRPASLKSLYENPDAISWLDLAHTIEDVHGGNLFIFKVKAKQS